MASAPKAEAFKAHYVLYGLGVLVLVGVLEKLEANVIGGLPPAWLPAFAHSFVMRIQGNNSASFGEAQLREHMAQVYRLGCNTCGSQSEISFKQAMGSC